MVNRCTARFHIDISINPNLYLHIPYYSLDQHIFFPLRVQLNVLSNTTLYSLGLRVKSLYRVPG